MDLLDVMFAALCLARESVQAGEPGHMQNLTDTCLIALACALLLQHSLPSLHLPFLVVKFLTDKTYIQNIIELEKILA